MIELRDWTTDKPAGPDWYAYRCPDPITGIEMAFQFDFVFVLVWETRVDGVLWVSLPMLGDRIPIRVADIGGEWCGPFVMGE